MGYRLPQITMSTIIAPATLHSKMKTFLVFIDNFLSTQMIEQRVLINAEISETAKIG